MLLNFFPNSFRILIVSEYFSPFFPIPKSSSNHLFRTPWIIIFLSTPNSIHRKPFHRLRRTPQDDSSQPDPIKTISVYAWRRPTDSLGPMYCAQAPKFPIMAIQYRTEHGALLGDRRILAPKGWCREARREEAVVGNCPEDEIYDESGRAEPVSVIIHSVLSTHADKMERTQISAGSFHWRAYLRAGRRNMSGSRG